MRKDKSVMGYYISYSMTMENATPQQKEAIIQRLKDKGIIPWALDEDLNPYDSVTWYDEEKNMAVLSKDFPTVHFMVHGKGEEQGDIWDHHYLGGKIQRCEAKIVIPKFDPSKLVDL